MEETESLKDILNKLDPATIGIIILLAIVIISSIPIISKKPRQILSQMN